MIYDIHKAWYSFEVASPTALFAQLFQKGQVHIITGNCFPPVVPSPEVKLLLAKIFHILICIKDPSQAIKCV